MCYFFGAERSNLVWRYSSQLLFECFCTVTHSHCFKLCLPSGGLEELAVSRRLPKAYSTGFVGCIKDVVVDGVELHLVEDALNSPKILHCSAAK